MALPGKYEALLPAQYKQTITSWLTEDCPSFDYGGFVVGHDPAEAKLLGKSGGVLAGVPFFNEVFRQLDCSVEWHCSEGSNIMLTNGRSHVATVRGPCRKILLGERVALNILARCSGIATRAERLRAKLNEGGYTNVLCGTRKTTPGFRLVEKYGMLVGGCDTHRMDLSAMTMLKDNHIVAAGDIPKAIAAARAVGGIAMKIEVECQNESEADEAIAAGADIVMLDNFSGAAAQSAAHLLKTRWNGQRSFLIEVSGGLNEDNALNFVAPDVDIISTSSIHQGVSHLDFSLKILKST